MMSRRRSHKTIQRICHDEDGASAVEFAIVAAILVSLCLAILQFGWALQIRNELAKAADEAIRYVTLNPESDDADFEAEARNALDGYDQDRLTVDAGTMTAGATEFRTLNVQYSFGISVPGLPANSLALSVSRRTPDLDS